MKSIRCAFLLGLHCCVVAPMSISAEETKSPSEIALSSAWIQKWIDENLPVAVEDYWWLHEHPELSYQEEETAKYVAAAWKSAGLEVTTGVGGHGVVALLKNGAGPTLMLRTDLDALPVSENLLAERVLPAQTIPVCHRKTQRQHVLAPTQFYEIGVGRRTGRAPLAGEKLHHHRRFAG